MILLTYILTIATPLFAQNAHTIQTVVIDAGHGGKDPGCSGKSSNEKDITLLISQKLGEMISDNYPNKKIIYTRNTDKYLSLSKRARIANDNNADLFISIHCNASAQKSTLVGSETYVLGLHRTEDNLEIVKRENVFHEGDMDVSDSNGTANHILSSLYQEAMINRSTLIARLVEERLQDYTLRPHTAVKQAGFAVLRETTMPSILIETGYLTTPTDEVLLNSEEGQYTIALAIYNAFVDYQYLFESPTDEETIVSAIQVLDSTEEQINDLLADDQIMIPSSKKQQKIIEKEVDLETIPTPEKDIKKIVIKETSSMPISEPLTTVPLAQTYPVQKKKKIKAKPVRALYKSKPISEPKQKLQPTVANPNIKKFYPAIFYIQIRSSPTPLGEIRNTNGDIIFCEVKKEQNLYKYITVPKMSYTEAKKVQIRLQSQGFKDAFLVAYKNNKRISVLEAIK